MRKAGEVTYVDAHNRMGRGRGEACFVSRDDMFKALDTLQGLDINGKEIRLSIKVFD
jgi:arginine/serine-rich splicing factor 4/5/6